MRLVWFLLGLVFSSSLFAAPDEAVLGKAEGYPLCPRPEMWSTRCLVGSVSRFDRLFPAHRIAKSEAPREFKRAAAEPSLYYRHNQFNGTLEHYLERNRTTGLLVLKDDTILVERYQYERKDSDRMNSFSMAKTVVAMLVGIAIAEKHIASVEDRAEQYVPALKGTPYSETPLRHLLTMSSGVRFVEDNLKESDINILSRNALGRQSEGGPATVAPFRTRERPPGQVYNYASADTQVLGLVLRAATGRTLSDYLAEKIWQPMGAEADAFWVVDRIGQEVAYAWFNATVRDYARFGMLLANGGARDGRQIIPREWISDATRVHGAHLDYGMVQGYFGYGYQTWLLPGGSFAATGFRGQAIYVDPKTRVVMVHTGAREAREPGYREQVSLWLSVAEQLGRDP